MTAFDNTVRGKKPQHQFFIADLQTVIPAGAGVSAYPSVIWDDRQTPPVPFTNNGANWVDPDGAVLPGAMVLSSGDVVASPSGETDTGYTATVTGNAGAVTWSLGGSTDDAFFAIDASTGALTWNSTPTAGGNASEDSDDNYNITIIANDGTVAQSFPVTIKVVAESGLVPASLPLNDTVNANFEGATTLLSVYGCGSGGADYIAIGESTSSTYNLHIFHDTGGGTWGTDTVFALAGSPTRVYAYEDTIFVHYFSGSPTTQVYTRTAGTWALTQTFGGTNHGMTATGTGTGAKVAIGNGNNTVQIRASDGSGSWNTEATLTAPTSETLLRWQWDDATGDIDIITVRNTGSPDQYSRAHTYERPGGGTFANTSTPDVTNTNHHPYQDSTSYEHEQWDYNADFAFQITSVNQQEGPLRVYKRNGPADYELVQQLMPRDPLLTFAEGYESVQTAGGFVFAAMSNPSNALPVAERSLGFVDVWGPTGDPVNPFVFIKSIGVDPASAGYDTGTAARLYGRGFGVTNDASAFAIAAGNTNGVTTTPVLIYT